jgi:RNA polymerase subunit RPABC4/transcription elongation factor Spt4
VLRQIAPIAISVFVAFGCALWLSLIAWTLMDIRSRSRDPVVWFFSTVLAAIPLGGLIIYLILRPRETLMQAYERALEEEALLQEIEARPICPNCHQRIEPDFLLCPRCLTKLKDTCRSCKRLIEPDWTVCPYCATDRKYPMAIGGEQ